MSFAPENFTVWTEIPVTDLDRAMTFYNLVFGTELKKVDCGENPFAMFPTPNDAGLAGHLYPGNPAAKGTGPTVHLATPDRREAAPERRTGRRRLDNHVGEGPAAASSSGR